MRNKGCLFCVNPLGKFVFFIKSLFIVWMQSRICVTDGGSKKKKVSFVLEKVSRNIIWKTAKAEEFAFCKYLLWQENSLAEFVNLELLCLAGNQIVCDFVYCYFRRSLGGNSCSEDIFVKSFIS